MKTKDTERTEIFTSLAAGGLSGAFYGMSMTANYIENALPGLWVGAIIGMAVAYLVIRYGKKYFSNSYDELGYWWKLGALGGAFSGLYFTAVYGEGLFDIITQFGGGLLGGGVFGLIVGFITIKIFKF